ncbi:MAG TPA: response regulator transcription factor [Candidatus Methylomirabilis sp.]|nr:response regulator transcription factor [Candidatus Methylomirabilis sp.]
MKEMEPRCNPITGGPGVVRHRDGSSAWAPDVPEGFQGPHGAGDCSCPSSQAERLPLRILLVADHEVTRQGRKALLECEGCEVVAEVSDALEAVGLAQRLRPDVAVLDLLVPPLNGVTAAREILRRSPRTQTMLLSKFTGLQCVLEAIRAGVRGYLSEDEATHDLLPAIQHVAAGKVYLSPAIADTVIEAYLRKGNPVSETLSSRQEEVLRLLATGKSTHEIGAHLGISVRTVESHCHRIKAKLDVQNMASLVRLGIERSLTQPRSVSGMQRVSKIRGSRGKDVPEPE